MEIVLLFASFMLPAAIAWVVAFLLLRRSRIKRVVLFLVIYIALGFWTGILALIFAHVWLPGTLLTLGLFEWALARKSA
mgnify:CR=1 FL=1